MTGVDVPISQLLTDFEDNLWTDINTSFHGKIFRNERDGDIIPEVFVSGKEYREVKFDDTKDALCFFDVGNTVGNLSSQMSLNVMIVFAVNLSKAYPSISYRATEEAHRDVWNIVDRHRPTITPETLHIGIKAYGDISTKNLKNPNMQPWHVFSIETKTLINYLNCN